MWAIPTGTSSVLKKKSGKESQSCVSHPELGSDPPIGSDRDSGCDTTAPRDGKRASPAHFGPAHSGCGPKWVGPLRPIFFRPLFSEPNPALHGLRAKTGQNGLKF